ncbi:MAG: hypothetical protein IPM37_17150 [Hahellaceae bacterium]|nr:hypothetical protein [Hahellaceae bacterium]
MANRSVTLLTLGALLILVGLGTLPTEAQAEKIGISYQGEPTRHVDLPRKGETMANVERRFGSPQGRKEPVGQPPITVWEFPEYTVYFEHNHVIHTVLKPSP